jgi:hypothetical protein
VNNYNSIPKEIKKRQKEIQRLESKTVQFKPAGIGTKILDTVLGDGWASKLDLDDSLDEANLNVKLEISYNRTTTGSGQFVLDTIASSLRDLDNDSVRVELKNGGVITGKELKLSDSLNVQVHEGLLSEDDLYLKMFKWLSANILNGEIDNRGNMKVLSTFIFTILSFLIGALCLFGLIHHFGVDKLTAPSQ